jgi:hypothetical protein
MPKQSDQVDSGCFLSHNNFKVRFRVWEGSRNLTLPLEQRSNRLSTIRFHAVGRHSAYAHSRVEGADRGSTIFPQPRSYRLAIFDSMISGNGAVISGGSWGPPRRPIPKPDTIHMIENTQSGFTLALTLTSGLAVTRISGRLSQDTLAYRRSFSIHRGYITDARISRGSGHGHLILTAAE